MGEVYKAQDTRLAREVALKVLPQAFLADPDRLARFAREAQVLASLNHPNIGAIYGFEESNGVRALVLELVDGPTLADRVARGPVPLDEAMLIARQIAAGVEAAHEQGIIHRDLKPGNIKLRADGMVKVLDFGLAKALEGTWARPPSETPTMPTPAPTERGIIFGTPAYMSPEQARGKPTDERTDIWAFACIVFELLTGRPAFHGDTLSDTIAAVLERQPDWQLLPKTTPNDIVRLLRRCLAKDPNGRLHHIADVRLEIEEALAGPQYDSPSETRVPPQKRSRERLWWAAVVGGLLLLIIALVVSRMRGDNGQAAAARMYNAAIVLPDGVRLAGNPSGRFALSPDGRFLALSASNAAGHTMLWVRPLDTRVAQPLEGTEGASSPFWSPDSRVIGFQAQRKLKKVDVAGGDVVTLCDAPFGSGATWNSDGVILFTPRGDGPLFRVQASGGRPVQVTTLDTANHEVQHSYPFFLPDGQHFLYLAVGTKKGGLTDPRGVFLGSLDSRQPGTMLVAGASSPKYADDRLLFIRDGMLMAQPFDSQKLTLSGQETSIARVQIAGDMLNTTGVPGSFSISQTRVLAYQTGLVARSQLAWYDRGGTILGKLGDEGDYADVALSPDGSHVAVSLLDVPLGTRDLWIFDIARGLRERFTFDPGDDFGPNWSRPTPDRVVFSSRRGGSINLYEKAASGEGAESVFFADDLGKFNASFSADGRYLAYVAGGGAISRSDIWILPVGDRKAFPFMDTEFVETHPQFSPDGRWLAYTSNESGQFEVYVTSFPGKAGKWRVSGAGGGWPRWNRNGTEIFYLAPNNDLIAVSVVANESEVHLKTGRTLFTMHPRPRARLDAYPYDVAADGQRFIVNTLVDEPVSSGLTLIVNWTAAPGQR